MESETEKDKQSQTAKNNSDQLTKLAKVHKELADEYVAVKTNYLAAKKAHEQEVGVPIFFLSLVSSLSKHCFGIYSWRFQSQDFDKSQSRFVY